MSAGGEEKKNRIIAKRLFTRANNALVKAITAQDDAELVMKKSNDLEKRYSEVQEAHEQYVCAVEDTEDYNESECEKWIDEIENTFTETERKYHTYMKGANDEKTVKDEKLTGPPDDQVKGISKDDSFFSELSKSKVSERDQCYTLREFERKEMIHEAEKIKKLSLSQEVDKKVIAKLLQESQHDMKKQMERCKNAQAHYLSTLDREDVGGELQWTDSIHDIYTETAQIIAMYTSDLPAEDSRSDEGKRNSIGLKLQRMPLPKFDGEIREYPRFKSDFRTQVVPSISNEQQMYVLKSCLTGTPLELVKNVDHNVQEMWKRLDDRYGEPSKLVDVIMYDIKKMKSLKDNEDAKFIKLVDTIESAYRDLERLSLEHEVSNSQTVSFIEEILPPDIRTKWAEKLKGSSDSEIDKSNKFPALLEFLIKRKSIIEYLSSDLRATTGHAANVNHVKTSGPTQDEQNKDEKKSRTRCWIHNSDSHSTQECSVFKQKSADERLQLVKEQRACWSCLKVGHRSADCRFRKKCDEDGCTHFHHPVLHECHVLGLTFHAGTRTEAQSNELGACLLQLMKIETTTHQYVNTLWDGGSTLSLITFKKANELQLKGKEVKLAVTKVGGETEEIASCKYELGMKDQNGKSVYVLLYGIDKISTELESIDLSGVSQLFPSTLLNELHRPSGEIDVLIGFEYAGFHPTRKRSNGHLLVMENRFGKCLGGSHPVLIEKTQKLIKHVVIHHAKSIEIEKFFDIEGLGVECSPKCGSCRCGKCPIGGKDYSIKEEKELELIESGLTRKQHHWEVRYPWIKDPESLKDNYHAAYGMLKSTEKRLTRDKERAAVYQEQMEDMLTRGVASKLTAAEIQEYQGPVQYISHHEVINPKSTSTPVRIVFNSSAKFNGFSLNDHWVKGPDLMSNMLGIILRFREGRIAMAGDIKKMYHSIHISTLDQHTHRFLWRDMEVDREPDVYIMKRVSFGDKPAGAIATLALRKTAEEYKSTHPRAAEVILTNTYVDDLLDSFKDTPVATETVGDVGGILDSGGFEIKEWTSNIPMSEEVQSNVPLKEISHEKSKVLGTHWNPIEDTFEFKVKLNFSPKQRKAKTGPDLTLQQFKDNIPAVLTKRMILSQINGIYDPLGLLTPFTIKAKVMMQDLWKHETKEIGWDDALSSEMRNEWNKFFIEVFEVENLSFKRCLRPNDAVGSPMLIIFSDASEQAYGSCCYVRWEHSDNSFSSVLLCAKGRVAPVKKISIVRLELCAAITAKRLYSFIQEESRFEFSKTIFVVDSKIVQSMIHKDSYGFKTFVSVRIGEIQGSTDKNMWSWTESGNNIADWITRWKSPSDLGRDSEWQVGPNWLKTPESDWPIHFHPADLDLPEVARPVFATTILQVQDSKAIDVSRFSSYNHLLRVTARILVVFRHCLKPSLLNIGNELNISILKEAEEFWIRDAQSDITDRDIVTKYNRLGAKRRSDGIVVVGERLEYWMEATYNNKDLILLPHNHRLSRLYVELIHNQSHSGISSTTCKVRLKFWIIRLENIVRSVRYHCITCRKNAKKTVSQIMAPLPDVRLNPAPAWSSISLDLFGPFEIKGEVNKRARGKAYGLILNCLFSRAVHIDLITDYSTDAFLQGFRRFMSLRGTPNDVYSDPGSQIQGANNVLKEMVKNLDEGKMKEFAIHEKLRWHFTAADAQWQNGCSESLIRSCKKAISNAISTHVLTFSELLTVMYETANLICERPIGKTNLDISDGSYLCPNDLILGRATSRTASGPFDESKCPKRRYDFLQQIVEAFWIKWTRFYFPSLIIRQKWHVEHRNLEENDIVLIQDSNAVRGNWKMGKIVKAYPSNDGKVRKVDVQYKVNDAWITIDRPVQKLVLLLPVRDDETTNSGQ